MALAVQEEQRTRTEHPVLIANFSRFQTCTRSAGVVAGEVAPLAPQTVAAVVVAPMVLAALLCSPSLATTGAVEPQTLEAAAVVRALLALLPWQTTAGLVALADQPLLRERPLAVVMSLALTFSLVAVEAMA